MTRGIKITTKEKKLLESYENGKCPFCNSEIIGNPIKCPDYGYVFECGGEKACKYCVEDEKPNPDIYWCEECSTGYDFIDRYELSRTNMKPKGTQTTIKDRLHDESQ